MAEKQPDTAVNKGLGDETNMSVTSKSKRLGVSSISTARRVAIISKKLEAEKAARRLKLLEEESVQFREEEKKYKYCYRNSVCMEKNDGVYGRTFIKQGSMAKQNVKKMARIKTASERVSI